MNHNFIENELIILTKQTLDIFLKEENSMELIGLYCFYYYTAKWQKTNLPKCTTDYVAKALHCSDRKVRKIKKQLIDLGLIEDAVRIDEDTKKVTGHYIKMNYIFKNSTIRNNISDAEKSHPCNFPQGGIRTDKNIIHASETPTESQSVQNPQGGFQQGENNNPNLSTIKGDFSTNLSTSEDKPHQYHEKATLAVSHRVDCVRTNALSTNNINALNTNTISKEKIVKKESQTPTAEKSVESNNAKTYTDPIKKKIMNFINDYTSNQDIKDKIFSILRLRTRQNNPNTIEFIKSFLSRLDRFSNNSDANKINLLDYSIENGYNTVFDVLDYISRSSCKK